MRCLPSSYARLGYHSANVAKRVSPRSEEDETIDGFSKIRRRCKSHEYESGANQRKAGCDALGGLKGPKLVGCHGSRVHGCRTKRPFSARGTWKGLGCRGHHHADVQVKRLVAVRRATVCNSSLEVYSGRTTPQFNFLSREVAIAPKHRYGIDLRYLIRGTSKLLCISMPLSVGKVA